MKEGDIVLAPFRFSETDEAKLRPCLVWSVTPVSATLVFITSQKLAKGFEKEVLLNEAEAKSIGLRKASRIDFGKRDRCLRADVGRTIGSLSSLPRAKLKECFVSASAADLI